ncbi:cytochrome c biogenesis protein CcsA [Edaphobacter flagellatus]|uniref:cytochrome c biogenesis protein CcsA n=1 Tax=Edaphobacter flagellatus TaxID=1933044 RepID=UPI0021B3F8C6|nr:cytochrome c biogenesis protein CcsA [Edaphobacter flagellatus]
MDRSPILRKIAWLWLATTIAVLVVGFRQAIFFAPTEATMGNLQRIFYYHVTHATLGLVFPYINCAASLAFLYWRRRDPLKALTADALAVASAEVTVLYVGITLASGMLWGKPAWGIWWTWDARLTSELILWLLYISYIMLRRFSPSGQTPTLAAVLSVFAAIDIPIDFMSIEWWRTQHPAPVFGPNGGGIDPHMWPAVLWNLAGWMMWGVLLIALRFVIERRRQIAEQDAALLAIEASLETPQ